ncbi:type II secretion system protein [Alteromonadaceae bacterium M269]|nr:type II secretion system protein [Alteromonadaceae bacterium M269]
MMKSGFTLVELVVTIIIISILGTFAFSRFAGNTGFSEVTFQERLVSALRNIQQRAMQDTRTATIYQFNFSTSPPAFGPSTDLSGSTTISFDVNEDFLSTDGFDEISGENVNLVLSDQSSSFTSIRFNSLGVPLTLNGASVVGQCANGCQIDFVGEQVASVCIESQGYIRKC